jgi:hypothetical protein
MAGCLSCAGGSASFPGERYLSVTAEERVLERKIYLIHDWYFYYGLALGYVEVSSEKWLFSRLWKTDVWLAATLLYM